MDNQRLLIWGSFLILLWMTYQAWVQDYGPRPEPVADQPALEAPADDPGLPALPEAEAETPDIADQAPPLDGVPANQDDTIAEGETIRVTTDVLDIEISTEGGTLQSAALLKYPVEKDRPDVVVRLLDTTRNELGLIQTGLNSAGDGPKADHNARFTGDAKPASNSATPTSWSFRCAGQTGRASRSRRT